jgi:hypothetical protein
MEIKEKTIYFFKGKVCPICHIIDGILIEEKLIKKGAIKIEYFTVPDDEAAFIELQKLTDRTQLPILISKDKKGEIQIISGLQEKKDLEKYLKLI